LELVGRLVVANPGRPRNPYIMNYHFVVNIAINVARSISLLLLTRDDANVCARESA